jgi:GNAT superfamily N-acetyltransferase
MDVDAYHALAEPLLDEVFRERRFVPLSELFDREEMARANALDDASASGVVHRYGIWDGETLIGVYRGRQTDAAIYRMSVTAILPAWQRRGIYTALLDVVLEAARSVGFLQVESSHHADNNPVLIAKLAHGFVISGFEVSLRTGLMVTLVHRFSERARAQHRVNVSS